MAKITLPIGRWRNGVVNWLHRRQRVPRFLLMTLSGVVTEIPPQRMRLPLPFASRLLPPDPPSVNGLRRQLEQIAYDPRVEGVVLKIECQASAATYQSLRRVLLDFRASGKRLIADAHSFGPFQYYLACACDQIIMPPSAEWGVVGLLRDYVFIKDALDALGVGAEVVNVSPYKSAFDQFSRTDFSAESRAQAEWLLDALYDELVRGISDGRRMSAEQARACIDEAPMSAGEALECGLIDAALYEDELEGWLAPAAPQPDEPTRKRSRTARTLDLYDHARGALLQPYVQYTPRLIGVVRLEGTITEGKSQSLPLPVPLPLVGNRFAGAESVAQALRRAADDEQIAAVVLYVDSGGGSALASDLIAREVRRVREVKPVVAYMAGVAASGGYYVAALAQHIVAQPLTITGSIGVITVKPNLERAEGKLRLHRTTLQRGAHAGLNSLAAPYRADEHAAVTASVQRIYDAFKRIVAEGRKLNVDELEPLCGGRVWTGAMARERGLVDELGDLRAALDKARDLAGMPADHRPRAIGVTSPKRYMLSPAQAAAALWDTAALRAWLLRTHTWAILPWRVDIGD